MKLTTFLDQLKEEAEERRDEERKKLLAVSELDSYTLSLEDWYQRIRYQREIEALDWVNSLNKNAVSLSHRTYIEFRTD